MYVILFLNFHPGLRDIVGFLQDRTLKYGVGQYVTSNIYHHGNENLDQ